MTHVHNRCKLEPLPIDALRRFPVLMPPRGSIIRPLIDRLFLEHGIPEPPVTVETVSDSFGRAFVRERGAIWIISHGMVRNEIEGGAMIRLAFDTAPTRGPIAPLPLQEKVPAGG